MDQPLTVLRDYTDRVEAETVRIRLAAAGIKAIVTGEDAATALGLGGAVTWRMVRIEVPAEDIERAAAILEQDRRLLLEAGPWICSRCHEQNEAAFEVCWSCSKPRTDDDQRGRLDEPRPPVASAGLASSISVETPPLPPVDDANPYRPVLIQKASPKKKRTELPQVIPGDKMREDVTRCLRAAIVGTFVLPPLISFYCIYLLLTLSPDAYRVRSLRRRIIFSWVVTMVAIPLWLVLYHEMI